jgi:hypothetical protein
MRRGDCFQGINSIVGLSVKFVQINRHNFYDFSTSQIGLDSTGGNDGC